MERANFGMAMFGAAKIWHQFLYHCKVWDKVP